MISNRDFQILSDRLLFMRQCFTLVQDRLMSIATGNPHSNLDVDLLAQCEALVQHPCSTVRDGRLCAQAELTLIISTF